MRKETSMIGAIGSSGIVRSVDVARTDAAPVAAPKGVDAGRSEAAVPNPVAELVAQGAPVDMDKVSRLRAAIAEGSYKIDPQAIADRMMALDLPARA
jgi:negative regulator of flagellin synthesis FlgM